MPLKDSTINDKQLLDTTVGGLAFQGGTAGAGETSQAIGQSFTTTQAYFINGLNLYLSKVGTPTDGVYVEFLTGSITGTVVATSETVTAAQLNTNGYNRFNFYPAVSLDKGSKYYFRIFRTGARDTGNYFTARNDNTAPLANGERYLRDNNSWSSAATDLVFAVLGSNGNISNNLRPYIFGPGHAR